MSDRVCTADVALVLLSFQWRCRDGCSRLNEISILRHSADFSLVGCLGRKMNVP